jgi:hypothetical protein
MLRLGWGSSLPAAQQRWQIDDAALVVVAIAGAFGDL